MLVFRSCTLELAKEVRIYYSNLIFNYFFSNSDILSLHADSSLVWLTTSIRQVMAGGFYNIKSTLEVETFVDDQYSKI